MNEALSIREALEKYGKVIQPIKGTSMLPMLDEDKDAVELVEVKGRLQKLDLVMFQRPDGQLVLHRIISVRRNYFLICGDNSVEIEKVPLHRIFAVATGFYKNGTYVSCQNEEYLTYVRQRWKDYANREIIKKIPKELKVVMSLYRNAITGRKEEIQTSGNLVWNTVYKQCENQMIGAVVYPALENVNCPEAIREKFRKLNQQSLHRWLLFKAEREAVYVALEEQQIPYMSLKGIVYASLYPFAGVREIADNDILIHPEHAQAVKRYMLERGYRCETSWIHESYYKKPFLNFEFHTKLFKDKHIESFFCDVWNRATQIRENGCEFAMSEEDVYLHTVAHFHKHYQEGGSGLRAFADLYLLRKRLEHYDMHYINRKLEEMGLQEFEAFFAETAHQLFDGDINAIPNETVHYIFESGAYGTYENRANNAIRKTGTKKYFWSRVFLPYPNMCMIYPCLTKLPFLLPVFWVARLAKPVFNAQKRRRLKIEFAVMARNRMNSKKKNG